MATGGYLIADVGNSWVKSVSVAWQGDQLCLARDVDKFPTQANGCGDGLPLGAEQLARGNGAPESIVHLAIGSLGKVIRLVALGAEQGETARLAELAVLSTGAVVLDVLTAEDNRLRPELVERLLQLSPDAVLVFGGPEGADCGWLAELVEGLSQAEQRLAIPVLYGGNSRAILLLAGQLCDRTELLCLSGLDGAGNLDFTDARTSIDKLSQEQSRAAVTACLRSPWPSKVIPTRAALELAVAAHDTEEASLLLVDVGSATTDVISVRPGRELAATTSPWGLDSGLLQAADRANLGRINHWLGRDLSRQDWLDFCGNRSLSGKAADDADRSLQLAAARELIRLALRDHLQLFPKQLAASDQAPVRWWEKLAPACPPAVRPAALIGTGGLFAWGSTPGEALSILLDGVQPEGVAAVFRDRQAIWPLLGALQLQEPGATTTLLSASLQLLSTVICPFNFSGRGRKVLQAELGGARGKRLTLRAGDLVALGETKDQSWEVELQPSPEVDVGAGPGQRIVRLVEGGAVGLVFDCRGRNLPLPAEPIDGKRTLSPTPGRSPWPAEGSNRCREN